MWWVSIHVKPDRGITGDFIGVCIVISIPIATRSGRWITTSREYVSFRNRDLVNTEHVIATIKDRIMQRLGMEGVPRRPLLASSPRLLYELGPIGRAKIADGCTAWGVDINTLGAIPNG